jgi:hypothetical protein
MQIVASSMVVLEITHRSAFALASVSLAQALAFFLFAPVGRSVADHIDKRRLLLLTQRRGCHVIDFARVSDVVWHDPALDDVWAGIPQWNITQF